VQKLFSGSLRINKVVDPPQWLVLTVMDNLNHRKEWAQCACHTDPAIEYTMMWAARLALQWADH